MNATIWLVAAFCALILEFLSGSLYLLVTALALAAGGVAAWLGFNQSGSLLIASITAILGYTLLTYYRKSRYLNKTPEVALDFGQPVMIIELEDVSEAKVLYRGARWSAKIKDEFHGELPHRAYICGQDGNTLIVSVNKPNEG